MKLLVVDHDTREDAVVVRVAGDVDSSSAGQLTAHLDTALSDAAAHRSRLLIVDLQAVTYFGSSGLQAILRCHDQALSAETSVHVVAAQPAVVRPIEVTRLDTVLNLHRTLTDAVNAHRHRDES